MADNCDLVIAVYGGIGGGTKQTKDYALKKEIRVQIIDY